MPWMIGSVEFENLMDLVNYHCEINECVHCMFCDPWYMSCSHFSDDMIIEIAKQNGIQIEKVKEPLKTRWVVTKYSTRKEKTFNSFKEIIEHFCVDSSKIDMKSNGNKLHCDKACIFRSDKGSFQGIPYCSLAYDVYTIYIADLIKAANANGYGIRLVEK